MPPDQTTEAAIFDFQLSDEQMEVVGSLNANERTGHDPDTFDMIG